MELSKEEKIILISALLYMKYPEMDCELDQSQLNLIPFIAKKLQGQEEFKLPLYYFKEFAEHEDFSKENSVLKDFNINTLDGKDINS